MISHDLATISPRCRQLGASFYGGAWRDVLGLSEESILGGPSPDAAEEVHSPVISYHLP